MNDNNTVLCFAACLLNHIRTLNLYDSSDLNINDTVEQEITAYTVEYIHSKNKLDAAQLKMLKERVAKENKNEKV